MFLDNLAVNVLRLCDEEKLSYEKASEKCDLSPRYFGSITRGQTSPSIVTLEKLCTGFCLTPNDLLVEQSICRESAFRTPMPVTEIRCYRWEHGLSGFSVCPQCHSTLEWEYQQFCDRCGQRLDWKNYHKATIILP